MKMIDTTSANWAWQQDLPGSQKLVLLALALNTPVTIEWLAQKCGQSRSTTKRALHELETRRLITVERRAPQTSLYSLPELAKVQNDPVKVQNDPVRVQNDLLPKKPRNEPSPEQVETLYQAYPRHVGKPTALKAIAAALKVEAVKKDLGLPFPALLDKVRLYARSRAAAIAKEPEERKYTPHPATWFNQQRYKDDPAEWGINLAQDAQSNRRLKRLKAEDEAYHKGIKDLINHTQ